MDKQNDFDLEKDLDLLFDEDFDFKPITKGLGFHHSIKDQKEVSISLKKQQGELKEQLNKRAKTLNKNSPKASNMGDLAPFYQEQKKQSIDLELNQKETKEDNSRNTLEETNANMFIRVAAWLMDIVILLLSFSLSFVLMIFINDAPLEIVKELLMSVELFITVAPMLGIYYIFYFSFFDKTTFSTPGKRITGLRVVSSNGDNISMLQALMRSVITIVSVLTLGLLVILDAQSKITDTKVVKR